MIPLLGNVVENKKFRAYESRSQDHPRKIAYKVRPLLTNSCSGRRVGEARGRSGSSRSRSPTNSPSIYPTNKSPRRKRSSSKKDQRYDPSIGIHTSRCSNPAALRRPEKNATERN